MANKNVLIVFRLIHTISLLVALIATIIALGLLAHYTTQGCLLFFNGEKIPSDVPCRLSVASTSIAFITLVVVAIIEVTKQVNDKIAIFKINTVITRLVIAITQSVLQIIAFVFLLITFFTVSIGLGTACKEIKEKIGDCNNYTDGRALTAAAVFSSFGLISVVVCFVGFILWQIYENKQRANE